MMHDRRLLELADFIQGQRDYDQSDPGRCVAGMAKRMLRRQNPLSPRYWFPLATPIILRKAFGLPAWVASEIFTSGWVRRSGFKVTRWQAAAALRRLVHTREFSWH